MITITYIVRGSLTFPSDMLRYDGSVPATPEDEQWIESDSPNRELMLKIDFTGSKSTAEVLINTGVRPCLERWKSFLWRVMEVKIGDEVVWQVGS